MTEHGPEIIGLEILRVESDLQENGPTMGKERRKEAQARAKALRWALHASLTGDRTRTPGTEVETFLGALKAREGEDKG